MHISNIKAARSARAGLALALLLSGVLMAGPAAADKPGKGGKKDHDDRHSEQRDKHGNDGGSSAHNDNDGNRGKNGGDEHRFDDHHRTLVREYYVRETQSGHCPPGLAKKQNGCMPPGQAKKWNIGHALPRDVVYYPVPQSLVVQIGQPPSGYRYVRVASDILMLAIGTGMVVDAIQDLGRS